MKVNEGYLQRSSASDEPVIEQNLSQVQSEYLQQYEHLISESPSHINAQRILFQSKIIYNPQQPFEPFSFEVEQIVPVPAFFKISVKIAHFSLSITAIRHNQLYTSKQSRKIQGSFGIISFAQFDHRDICFKGFSFSNQSQFQSLFKRVVKELSILKICSALQCSPYLESYFGFDLIIYDNYIQYATQQGQIIESFSKTDQQHLRCQLALLHRLKIIHYDIKPQNIIFSSFYQKAVFIDFGMSQIIEEQLGFKTFGFFRGTPTYCTSQMISLMSEQPNYIDLYYNDAYCLNISVKQMETKNSKYLNRQFFLEQKEKNRQQWLYILPFKYYYLHGKEFECKCTLERYLLKGGKIEIVLSFIKQVFRYIFIDSVLNQSLKQYKDHIIYQQIIEQRKLYIQRIFFRRRQEGEDTNNERSLIPISYLPNKQDSQGFDKGKKRKDYIHFLQFILKITIFEEKTVWNYLSLTFNCIRFDTRNLLIQQKYSIAKKINPLLASFRGKNSAKVDQGAQLLQIKLLMQSILQYSLETRPNAWSKDNLIDVFEQLAILDVDLSNLIDPFLLFLQCNALNPLQSILFTFQCNRLKNTMLLIHSNHMEKVEIVQNKIRLFIQRNIKIFKEEGYQGTNKEILSIRSIIYTIQINDDPFCQRILGHQDDLLAGINNPKIRKVLFYLLVQKDVSFQNFIINNESLIQKALYLKRCWESNKYNFFCWLQVTIKIMKLAQSNVQLQGFFKEAGRIINCKQIMDDIMENSWILLSSHQTIFNQKINKLLVSYPKLGSLSKTGDIVLHLIVEEISSGSIIINEKLQCQLKKLYFLYQESYKKQKLQKRVDKFECMHHFCQTFWRAEIQAFFYAFSPETQGMLRLKLEEAEQAISIIKSNKGVGECQKFYSYFKFYLYRFNFLKLQDKFQQSICNLLLFIPYCERLNLQIFILEGLKKIKQLACKSANMSLINASTYELYSFCIRAKFLSFYLLPHHSSYTFITIITFAQDNQQIFYQFLWNLIQFLHNHYMNSYFATVLQAFDKFLQKDNKNGYLIHYCRLEEKYPFMLKNPYFLIFYMYSLGKEANIPKKLSIFKAIATNVDHLGQFAKRKILERYFIVFLSYLKDKKQQQRLFNFRKAKIFLRQDKIILEAKKLFYRRQGQACLYKANSRLKEKLLKIIENTTSKDIIFLES